MLIWIILLRMPPTSEMETFAEIDLSAIQTNVKAIRSYIDPAKVIAVIKADAYGHGAIPVARTLADDVMMFAVATVDEAIELRQAEIHHPILILYNVLPHLIEKAVIRKITLTVSEAELPKALSQIAQRKNRDIKIHVNINTGMNQDGVQCNQAVGFLQWLNTLPGIMVEGVFTHFATADKITNTELDQQLCRFNSVIDKLGRLNLLPVIVHAANSSAMLKRKDTHFDAVRIGLTLFGLNPLVGTQDFLPLQSALEWKTRVISTKEIGVGEGISYGFTYRAEKPIHIATARIGYADGYSRLLSNTGIALIGGKTRKLAGQVCMDVSVFEVDNSVNIGDEVVLIGWQGNYHIDAAQMAKKIGTITYEILTGISKRVPRIYRD